VRDDTLSDQGKKTRMTNLSRRSVLRSSLPLVSAGTLARPYIANAAAEKALKRVEEIFAKYQIAQG